MCHLEDGRFSGLTSQSFFHLCLRLANAEHDACLGDDLTAGCFRSDLGVLQYRNALFKVGSSISHKWRAPRNCLDVVSKNIQPRQRYGVDMFEITGEIRRQSFDQDIGSPVNFRRQSKAKTRPSKEPERLLTSV